MGDASIKGRSPLLKGGRVGLRTGGAYGPLRGTTAGGVAKAFRGKEGFKESQALQKKLLGPARATGPIKSKGKVIGTRIAKAGSKKAMGIPRAPMTKSDYALKHQIKRIQKTPDKKFKHQNPETEKVKSLRTGRVYEVRKKDPVKGSIGKKTYIQDTKYYHHRAQPKGTK